MLPCTTASREEFIESPPIPARSSYLLRAGLFVIGVLATLLGILGIVLPLLPTVPLLLLAAACFARSSERCYRWLIDHPRLGPLFTGYLDGKGIPLRAKLWALVLLWCSISLTALFFVPLLPVRLLLFVVATGVTLYLLRLPTRDADLS